MMRNSKNWAAVMCLLGLASCGSTPITTTVTPALMTIARIQTVGVFPANCNDWLSPSWKTPQEWWNSLNTTQPPNMVGQAAVGLDLLFDTHPAGGCTKFRQDLYRAGFSYDLSQRQNLKGLVTAAELSYSSFIVPSGVTATSASCQLVTGGGGPLLILRPGETLPAAVSRFAYLGAGPSATAYPLTATVFNMPQPWQAHTYPGVQAGVTVTSLATGLGGASFTVDVTSYLNGALGRGDMAMSFMLGGLDEAPITGFPPGAIDCKTVYKVGDLIIKHM